MYLLKLLLFFSVGSLFPKPSTSQSNKSFTGSSVSLDSIYSYKLDVVISFKSDNLVEAILKYDPQKLRATPEMVKEYKIRYKREHNGTGILFAKVDMEREFKHMPPKSLFFTGVYDADKQVIKLYEKKSFAVNQSGPQTINFLYANNRLIDLDTTGPRVTAIIQLTETDINDKNSVALINEIKNKKSRDFAEIKEHERREIAQQKEIERVANNENRRVENIRKATAGDLMVHIEDAKYSASYDLAVYSKNAAYTTMVIKSYIERVEGQKLQIRIADITYNLPEVEVIPGVPPAPRVYPMPKINDVRVSKGDIVWINPYKDQNWYWGEIE